MLRSERLLPATTSFADARFVGLDFDGTMAQTFLPSPHNISVNEAYCGAIDAVFGLDALTKYQQEGGHCNRAPIEIVRQLAGDANAAEQTTLLKQLDEAKLGILLPEIGPSWPLPVPGFASFSKKIEHMQAEHPVDVIVTSSGHDAFIRRTLDVWGIFRPSAIVAQELIQQIANAHGETMPFKPDQRVISYAAAVWHGLYRITSGVVPPSSKERQRMSYVGDGAVDRELAANAQIAFHYIDASAPEVSWQRVSENIEALHAA